MTRWTGVMIGVLACALATSALAASEGLERFERAAAQFPDDRDLSWALAQARMEAGEADAAVAQLRRHLERWPDDPPGGWLVLGQWLLQQGRNEGAELALEHALARDPGAAEAHLALGLALRRQNRLPEAERHYRMAARLDSALKGEALLLASLARLEQGDEAVALEGLREVVALDPDSEAARNARLVLSGSAARRSARLRLDATAGFQFDSNVTLESEDTEFTGSSSDQEDVAFTWGSQLRWRAVESERWEVELGGRYDENAHLDVTELDTRRVFASFSTRVRPSESWMLRLDGWGGPTYLDGDVFLWSGAVQPSFFYYVGPRFGALRLYGEAERLSFDGDPSLEPLERDGWAYGGGLEHYGTVADARGLWFASGVGYTRRDTDAERDDLLGFDGAYDHHRWQLLVRAGVELPLSLKLAGDVQFQLEDYDHENLVDLLTDNDGLGDANPDARRDQVWRIGLRLSRPVTSVVDAELSWSFTDRASNVDVFSYDRHIAGLAFRVRTP